MKGTLQQNIGLDEVQAVANHRRDPVKRMLEGGRYLVLIGVLASLAASAGAFVWGAYKTVVLLLQMLETRGADAVATTGLVALMDKFLIATGLYIFAVGMYELFIDDLDLPPWLIIHSLHDIKAQLVSIVVLLLAIVFLEHVIEWRDPQAVLQMGLGIAAVIAALIAFTLFVKKE